MVCLHDECIRKYYIFGPKYVILHPDLNNNRMAAVIGRSLHVTNRATFWLVGGGVEYYIWSHVTVIEKKK